MGEQKPHLRLCLSVLGAVCVVAVVFAALEFVLLVVILGGFVISVLLPLVFTGKLIFDFTPPELTGGKWPPSLRCIWGMFLAASLMSFI